MSKELSLNEKIKFWFNNKKNGKYNKFLVSLFLCLTIVNYIMACTYHFSEPNKVLQNIINILMGVVPFMISICMALFEKKEDKEVTKTKEKNPTILLRKETKSKLWDFINGSYNRKIKFVTGLSGTGKSTLLWKYCEENYEKCFYKSDNYYSTWSNWDDSFNEKEKEKIKIVIFDQFEQTLNDRKVIKNLSNKINNSDKHYIFCFRQEYLAEMYNYFPNYINNNTLFFLYNSREDNNDMEKAFQECLSIKESDSIEGIIFDFYKKICDKCRKGEILFIEFALICDIIKNSKNTYSLIRDFLKEEKSNSKNSIRILCEQYISDVLENIKHSQIAGLIIYLLVSSKKNIRLFNKYDFCNITFEDPCIVDIVVKDLSNLNIIVCRSKDNGMLSQYEISHDYLFDILKRRSIKVLNADIINNIDNYAADEKTKGEKNKIYEDFKRDKLSKISHRIFMLICVSAMLIQLPWFQYFRWSELGLQNFNMADYFFKMATNNLISLFSIFYMYNVYVFYCELFALKSRFIIWGGYIAVILSFLFPEYWAVCYGAEIIVLGLFYIFLRKKARESEKKFFETRTKMYIIIGSSISGLGVLANLFIYDNYIQMLPVIIIYSIYVLISIVQHVTWDYLVSLLGKFDYE